MKHIFTLTCTLILGVVSVFGAGKGDQVSATNVFPGKLFSSISIGREKTTLNYNENNQLTSVSAFEETVTFDYTGGEIDGFSYDVSMIIKDEDETLELYIRLNDQLFASEVYEVEKETGYPTTYDKWQMEYNSEGQLSKVTRTESSETFTMTFENGNITKVLKEEPYESDTFEISYQDQIANTSGFMMYDLLGVDVDEMEIAYFAGLLGKPTRCLPQKLYDINDRETEIFKWTVDADGYPTKLNYDGDTFTLAWTEASGINEVEIDSLYKYNNCKDQYYNLNGLQLSEPQKGLNIVRHSDGKVSKVINR